MTIGISTAANRKSQSSSAPSANKSGSTTKSNNQEIGEFVRSELLNWTGISRKKHKMSTENVQLAPLRSLDDFLMASARFQLPNFSDYERWGNRVVKNLCYYQTNYFVMIAVWALLMTLYQPRVILVSASILAVALVGTKFCVAKYGSPYDDPHNVKLMLYVLLPSAVILYLMDLIVFVLFVLLVPFCCEYTYTCLGGWGFIGLGIGSCTGRIGLFLRCDRLIAMSAGAIFGHMIHQLKNRLATNHLTSQSEY